MKLPWFVVLFCGLCFAAEPWVTHYTAADGGFATTLHFVSSNYENPLQVSLTPYDQAGNALPNGVRQVTVQPGERLVLDRDALAWNNIPVSHVQVQEHPLLAVSAVYEATQNSVLPATVAAQSLTTRAARYLPAGKAGAFDGLVVVNPNDTDTAFTLVAYDLQGNTEQTLQLTLAAKAKWLGLPANLFSEGVNAAGYVEIRAEADLFTMGLRGTFASSGVSVLTELALQRDLPTPAKLTYSNQIGRILQRKCTPCHYSGGIGPFPLTSYAEATVYPELMQYAVSDGTMPPWKAAAECADLKNSQALDPAEKAMLLNWLAGPLDQGLAERAPAFVQPPDNGWRGGTPTQTFAYPEAYEFKPGPDDYRCFPIPLNNSETLYLEGLEVLPGNLEFVHHVLLYAVTTAEGEALDVSEPGPGYTCFGGPETEEVRLLGGWAPGGDPSFFGENIGMKIEPNTTIVMQVHYHYNGTAGFDQTQFGLYLSSEAHEKELFILPLVNEEFVIPAGAKNFEVTESITLPNYVPIEMHLVMPHMHLLGQSISVTATDKDGGEQCLVNVPKWDFNWQKFYNYQAPINVPGGSTIKLSCIFDNSSDNPFNPNSPPLPVRWGDATTDEMALAFLGIVFPFDIEAKDAPWQWPHKINAAGVNLEKRRTNPLNNLPSCCQKGDEGKPWKKCDTFAKPGEPSAEVAEPPAPKPQD